MLKANVMKKAGVSCLMALALACAALVCAPATATASELTAAKGTASVKSTAFRTVSSPAAPKVDACLASGAGKIAVHASYISGAQGYQFQIASNSEFTKGVKTKKATSLGTTFTGLAKGKKYYVRARAYQTKTNLCTKWSKAKSTTSGIAYSKSKITGTWKVTSINNPSQNSVVAYYAQNGKYIKVTFNKKGTATLKDYSGTEKARTKWVATAKNKGHEYSNYQKTSSFSLKNGTLTYKSGTLKMTLKRA